MSQKSPKNINFIDQLRQSKNEDSKETNRLKQNIDAITSLVDTHKKEIHKINARKVVLQKHFSKEIEGHKMIATNYQALQEKYANLKDDHATLKILHAKEKQRANKLQQLHSTSHEERNKLSDVRHDLELKIIDHMNKQKGEFNQQENLVSQLQKNLAAEKDLVEILESDLTHLENTISDRENKIAEAVQKKQILQKDKEQLMKNQECLEKDLDYFQSELKTARRDYHQVKIENEELNNAIDITAKKYGKLRNAHDTLLSKLNYKEFRQDLDNKLYSFDNVSGEQELDFKGIEATDFEYKQINEDLEEIIRDASNETRAIESLKQFDIKIPQSSRGGAVATKRSKAPASPSSSPYDFFQKFFPSN